jgi:hypothetical protein
MRPRVISNAIVAAVIGGLFLLANTILTLWLTRRLEGRPRRRRRRDLDRDER